MALIQMDRSWNMDYGNQKVMTMNNHPYHVSFAVKEGFERASREIERQRLINMVKGQEDGHHGRLLKALSPTGLWNSVIAWVGQTADPAEADPSKARSLYARSPEPQEQCC